MPDTAKNADASHLRPFVFALFFIFGGITSLNDVIIPKLRELFTLDHTQAMLVQTAFFFAYAIVGLPGGALVRRIGYMRGAVVGLIGMIAGCLLFVPASSTAQFPLFLLALLVLAAGVVIVQVVTNPLISLLGSPETASSRLTFAQAFNSLGTTVFPYFGSIVILGSLASVNGHELSGAALHAYRSAETAAVVHAYLGLAAALAVVAGVVWLNRNRLKGEKRETGSILASFELLRRARFAFGMGCIFLYVGAEVSIGSMIVNYLEQASTLGLDERSAGKLIPVYWGGAMIGRFIGSAALRVLNPGKVLAFNAVVAIALILVSANASGALSGYALLAIGLANSIMFPTIFSLASEGLGESAAEGSGLINVAIVGGAIVPPLTGFVADHTGSLGTALLVPAICYVVIALFGLFSRTRVGGLEAAPVEA